MIAYVFWHQRRPDVSPSDYEDALNAFYRPLLAAGPAGLRRTAIFRTSKVPWLPAQVHTFEEWYLLDNSAALDALNDSAVNGDRLQPHNRVAAMAAAGTAGLYSLRLGDVASTPPVAAHWLSKPDGMSYKTFFDSIRPFCTAGAALWGRQMVLGPTPEFCLHVAESADLPYPSHVVELRSLFHQRVAQQS